MPIWWNSTYQMIESVLLYQQVHMYYELVDLGFRHDLFENKQEKGEVVATFLGYFMILQNYFSDASTP